MTKLILITQILNYYQYKDFLAQAKQAKKSKDFYNNYKSKIKMIEEQIPDLKNIKQNSQFERSLADYMISRGIGKKAAAYMTNLDMLSLLWKLDSKFVYGDQEEYIRLINKYKKIFSGPYIEKLKKLGYNTQNIK